MKIFALLALAAAFPLQAQAPAAGSMQHAAGHVEKAPVPVSHSVTVTYQGSTTTLTVEDLLKLPQVTVTVRNGHTNADETYSGRSSPTFSPAPVSLPPTKITPPSCTALSSPPAPTNIMSSTPPPKWNLCSPPAKSSLP